MSADEQLPNDLKQYAAFEEDAQAQYDVKKAKFEYTKAKVEIDLDKERWKNRRRMAWLALWAMIGMTVAMFVWVPESKLEKLDEIVAWFMMAMASIVGAYIGISGWAQVSQARRPTAGMMGGNSTPYDNYADGRLDTPPNKEDYYNEQ